jgi:hypothetical protein
LSLAIPWYFPSLLHFPIGYNSRTAECCLHYFLRRMCLLCHGLILTLVLGYWGILSHTEEISYAKVCIDTLLLIFPGSISIPICRSIFWGYCISVWHSSYGELTHLASSVWCARTYYHYHICSFQMYSSQILAIGTGRAGAACC